MTLRQTAKRLAEEAKASKEKKAYRQRLISKQKRKVQRARLLDKPRKTLPKPTHWNVRTTFDRVFVRMQDHATLEVSVTPAAVNETNGLWCARVTHYVPWHDHHLTSCTIGSYREDAGGEDGPLVLATMLSRIEAIASGWVAGSDLSDAIDSERVLRGLPEDKDESLSSLFGPRRRSTKKPANRKVSKTRGSES